MEENITTEERDREATDDSAESNGGTAAESTEQPKQAGEGDAASDEQLVESLAAQRGNLRPVGGEDAESRAGAAAVTAIRDGARLTEGEKTSALDWFLNEDPRAADEETQTKELNFGTQENPRWVKWTIKPVPMEVMRAVRRKAANTRVARQTGEVDEYRVNLEIVVEGTVDPDIRAAAAQLAQEKRGPGDPVDALRAKFQSKPGYIAQLAGQIMTLSGFNDEDVRDAEKAAKN